MKYTFEPQDIKAGLRIGNNTTNGEKTCPTYDYIIGYLPEDETKGYRMISLCDGLIGLFKTQEQMAQHLTTENFMPKL